MARQRLEIEKAKAQWMASTLDSLAWMDVGSYPCYTGMSEDLELAHTGRSIADKGYWVFEGLEEHAKNHPHLAANIREVITFYEEQNLVNPVKGHSLQSSTSKQR